MRVILSPKTYISNSLINLVTIVFWLAILICIVYIPEASDETFIVSIIEFLMICQSVLIIPIFHSYHIHGSLPYP